MAISNFLPSSRVLTPGVCTSTTRPAAPYNGQVIYETDTKQSLVWQGSAWVMLTDADQPPAIQLIDVGCSSGGTAANGVVTIGSAVSSVTVTNAFSASYDNYKIVINGGTASGDNSMRMELGTNQSGYYSALSYIPYSTGTMTTAKWSNKEFWDWVGESNTNFIVADFDVINPYATKYTSFTGTYPGTVAGWSGGYHASATSFTSFKIYPGAGTITGGTIRVYGYRNSI